MEWESECNFPSTYRPTLAREDLTESTSTSLGEFPSNMIVNPSVGLHEAYSTNPFLAHCPTPVLGRSLDRRSKELAKQEHDCQSAATVSTGPGSRR